MTDEAVPVADPLPDHASYKRAIARFMSDEQSRCYAVGLSGGMGSRTVVAAIREGLYRKITTPVIVLIITGWMGCWAACSAALIYVLGWGLGLTITALGTLVLLTAATITAPDSDWGGALAACMTIGVIALLVITKGISGLILPVLAVVVAATLWAVTHWLVVGRLRRSALDDPEFYAFGLAAGLMTLRNYPPDYP